MSRVREASISAIVRLIPTIGRIIQGIFIASLYNTSSVRPGDNNNYEFTWFGYVKVVFNECSS